MGKILLLIILPLALIILHQAIIHQVIILLPVVILLTLIRLPLIQHLQILQPIVLIQQQLVIAILHHLLSCMIQTATKIQTPIVNGMLYDLLLQILNVNQLAICNYIIFKNIFK